MTRVAFRLLWLGLAIISAGVVLELYVRHKLGDFSKIHTIEAAKQIGNVFIMPPAPPVKVSANNGAGLSIPDGEFIVPPNNSDFTAVTKDSHKVTLHLDAEVPQTVTHDDSFVIRAALNIDKVDATDVPKEEITAVNKYFGQQPFQYRMDAPGVSFEPATAQSPSNDVVEWTLKVTDEKMTTIRGNIVVLSRYKEITSNSTLFPDKEELYYSFTVPIDDPWFTKANLVTAILGSLGFIGSALVIPALGILIARWLKKPDEDNEPTKGETKGTKKNEGSKPKAQKRVKN